jgi:hypothetical protein
MTILDRLFKSNTTPARAKTEDGLRLVEGVESVWNYHLAFGPATKALCDPRRTMMSCPAPLSTWGYRSHIPSSYCRECERLAVERNLGLPESVRSAKS